MYDLSIEYQIDEFMIYCRSRELRAKTLESYEHTLRLFERWCNDELNITQVDQVTESVIRRYITNLQERGKYTFYANEKSKEQNFPERRRDFRKPVSAATINNYIRNLKVFFNWLDSDYILKKNPMKKVRQLKTNRNAKEYISDADFKRLVFDLLNEEFFESELSRPTITIQSTPKAYGHFTLSSDTWISKLGGTHEINIGAGTLSRPIENVCATLLHEMVHYFNYENGIQDTSRGGTYHNKRFKTEAEARGLIVAHSEKYGWSHTSPSDELLDFVLINGLTDILINRNEFSGFQITGTGTHSGTFVAPPRKPSSTRKYICPCCGMSVRATRTVRIACMDCSEQMIEV